MYRSDSYKCTLQLSKYLRSRDRVVRFPFDDYNDEHNYNEKIQKDPDKKVTKSDR